MSNPSTQSNSNKFDLLGALSNGLCLIHCLITPFLFVAHAGVHAHHTEGPIWWRVIDIALLLVSLLAVYASAKRSSKPWLKIALPMNWLILVFIVVNEKTVLIFLPEVWIYVPSIALIALHGYSWRCEHAGNSKTSPSRDKDAALSQNK